MGEIEFGRTAVLVGEKHRQAVAVDVGEGLLRRSLCPSAPNARAHWGAGDGRPPPFQRPLGRLTMD